MRISLRRLVHAVVGVAVLAVFTPLASPIAAAQSYTLKGDSKLWVDGTSNKNDWTVEASEIDATATIDNATHVPSTVQLTVPAAKLKGGRSTIMDRLMRDALKVEEHPNITYELVEVTSNDGSKLSTNGNLTLAGVTRQIQMDVNVEETSEGIRYTGSVPLKMSDFEIRPPTAMFGALRTGDEVTVGFDVVFVPQG